MRAAAAAPTAAINFSVALGASRGSRIKQAPVQRPGGLRDEARQEARREVSVPWRFVDDGERHPGHRPVLRVVRGDEDMDGKALGLRRANVFLLGRGASRGAELGFYLSFRPREVDTAGESTPAPSRNFDEKTPNVMSSSSRDRRR